MSQFDEAAKRLNLAPRQGDLDCRIIESANELIQTHLKLSNSSQDDSIQNLLALAEKTNCFIQLLVETSSYKNWAIGWIIEMEILEFDKALSELLKSCYLGETHLYWQPK
ncbi:hypothetical protein [Acidithrix ferrooxidans]|uniref:Uncharacterized protein n=1 Tax=Acidithrix ferrooxidans TaxID=1280514 RepID=A0A0D8HD96_9ACTN|nr:hypothetical protein [Acidithrix ferrooxidans]KJF15920.1 hypothetical protein AXFE_32530 [Acidithrix ferrooxidans]